MYGLYTSFIWIRRLYSSYVQFYEEAMWWMNNLSYLGIVILFCYKDRAKTGWVLPKDSISVRLCWLFLKESACSVNVTKVYVFHNFFFFFYTFYLVIHLFTNDAYQPDL